MGWFGPSVSFGRIQRATFTVSGLSLAMLVASGCQNSVKDENERLWQQNRELQARMEERNAMRGTEPPVVAPQPIPTATAPAPVKPTPAPTPMPPISPTPAPTDLGGEVTVDPAAGTTTVNFVGDTLFDSGQATLKAGARTSLDKMVAALKQQYAGKPVKVQGHTDSDPIKVSKWHSNQELSEARAKAVRDYLVQKGVEASRVTAEGFGDSKPKTMDKKSKSQNRRVEIVVLTN